MGRGVALVLLDTCALVWWTLDPDRLSRRARARCARMESTEGGCISSISIWEIGVKIKNRKLDIGLPLSDFVGRLRSLGCVEIIAVDEQVWLENLSLDWRHRDPADRTIVATARLRGVPIITSDRVISSFYRKVIW